jgi:hypothetical protein
VNSLHEFDRKLLRHERSVDECLRVRVLKLEASLEVNRLAQGLPASLNPVNAHRDGFDQIKVLGVLRKQRFEIS